MDVIRFIKDWTLPVAMGTGAALYLVFAFTPQLDAAATALGPFFATILPLFMFLILFVTFCKVDFRQLRPVAWHFWVGVFQVLFIGVIMAVLLMVEGGGSSPLSAASSAASTSVTPPCSATLS